MLPPSFAASKTRTYTTSTSASTTLNTLAIANHSIPQGVPALETFVTSSWRAHNYTNFLAEPRSAVGKVRKTIGQFQVKFFHHKQELSTSSRPLLRPLKCFMSIFSLEAWAVFRTIGVISDRDILEYICYDMQDIQMLETLKPCIGDGFVIQDREVAPDFIDNRGAFFRDRFTLYSSPPHLHTHGHPLLFSSRPLHPVGSWRKIAKPRQLHNTHWGMVCPAETPEGQTCGLVKNLALITCISVGSYSAPVIDFLEEWGLESLEENAHSSTPSNLSKTIKKLRRKDDRDISPEVSVVRDIWERELRLYTDAGRKHVRWIANGQNDEGAEYKWEQLVKGGIVELLDAEEETYDFDDAGGSGELAVTVARD
ncbi:DNA-dependent RNA polymerase II [Marasmius sp. AFHP31]|nr:DNA-dependent RNA polymerase II [Marasmius sp. AFHP31]